MNDDGIKQLNAEFRITGCYDSFGNVMLWWFTIADHLTFETELECPLSWGYRPSPLGPSNDPDDYTVNVCRNTNPDMLLRFGLTLERYARRLERAGKSY